MKLGRILEMQSSPLGASEESVRFQRGIATSLSTSKPLCVISYLWQQRTSLS